MAQVSWSRLQDALREGSSGSRGGSEGKAGLGLVRLPGETLLGAGGTWHCQHRKKGLEPCGMPTSHQRKQTAWAPLPVCPLGLRSACLLPALVWTAAMAPASLASGRFHPVGAHAGDVRGTHRRNTGA